MTKVDVDRAELALVRAEQAAIESRFAQAQAYRALATLIQSDRAFKVRPANSRRRRRRCVGLESALHLRPEFRALELTTKSAEAQRRAQAWRWAPSLSAFGSLRAFNYDNFAVQRHALGGWSAARLGALRWWGPGCPAPFGQCPGPRGRRPCRGLARCHSRRHGQRPRAS